MEQLIPVLTDLGLPGVIIAGLAWAYWQKDKALQQSNRERIEPASSGRVTGVS